MKENKETACFLIMLICIILTISNIVIAMIQNESILTLRIQQERVNAEVQFLKNRWFFE